MIEMASRDIIPAVNSYVAEVSDQASAKLTFMPDIDVSVEKSIITTLTELNSKAYKALLDLDEIPQKTAACYFSDREEIGSVGNTGARANWLENFTLELCNATSGGDMVSCRRLMRNTKFLSADVTAGFDPLYADVYDTLNVAYLGKGIALEKYTGHRGKSSASEASCEFIEDVTNAFEKENIPWQITEMGKQDKGGGGTIAQYMTDLGMDVVDCGVPVLSMHAPFEVTSKADVYWTYRAYKAFMS